MFKHINIYSVNSCCHTVKQSKTRPEFPNISHRMFNLSCRVDRLRPVSSGGILESEIPEFRIPKDVFVLAGLWLLLACTPEKKAEDDSLAQSVANDKNLDFVKQKALAVIKTGFNAGDGYREV